MNSKLLLAGASIAAMVVALPAAAAPLLFELSGSRNASFTFDPATTTPDFFSSSFIGDQVSYNSIAGTFGGVQGTAFVGFGTFLVASLNIQSPNLGFTQFAGPGLFTVSDMRPVFTLGTFQLTSIVSGASTLTISAATAVPEASTWALMLAGFGMIGATLRYRRRSTTIAYA